MKKIFTISILLLLSSWSIAQTLITVQSVAASLRLEKSKSPYSLQSNLVITSSGTLVIEPGVELRTNGRNIDVYGTLLAEGSTQDSIHFVSTNKLGSVNFYENSINTKIKFCHFKHFNKPIYLYQKAQPQIEQSSFSTNITNGVYCSRLECTNNVSSLDSVFISGGSGFKWANLKNLGSKGVYVFTGSQSINPTDTLIIRPGVHLILQGMSVQGTLIAEGGEQDSIFFDGKNKSNRIDFYEQGNKSKISYASFKNYDIPLYLLSNSKPVIARVNFANNKLNGVGIYSTLNSIDNISIIKGSIFLLNPSETFKKVILQNLGPDGSYTLLNSIRVRVSDTLVLEPGCHIKTNDHFIYNYGNIQAIGTESDSIKITGSNKSGSIIFYRGSSKSTLRYLHISNMYNGLIVQNPITISHCTIKNSVTGLSISLNRNEVQNTFLLSINNNTTGIVTQSGQLNINLSEISQNTQQGVSAAQDTVIASSCWWGTTSGPFHPQKNPAGQSNTVTNKVSFIPILLQSPIMNNIILFPNRGGNTGDVTVNIYGSKLNVGYKYKLRQFGQADIIFTNTQAIISEMHHLQIVMDLRGRSIGKYDVVLIDQFGQETVIKDGFQIEPGSAPDISSDLIGQNVIRSGVSQMYSIVVKNKTNIDLKGLPVYILVPQKAQLNLLSKLIKDNESDTLTYVNVDTVKGKPFRGRLYMLFLAKIASQVSTEIQFEVETREDVSITCWVLDRPYYNSPISQDVLNCGSKLMVYTAERILDFVKSDVESVIACSYGIGKILDPVIDLAVSGKQGDVSILKDLGKATLSSFYSCFEAVGILVPERLIWKGIKVAVDGWLKVGEPLKELNNILYGSCSNIFTPRSKQEASKDIRVIRAVDPNDKLGPQFTSKKHVSNTHTTISYQIRFENDPKLSTADAQVVQLIDTLDRTKFNLQTLQLKQFYFGNVKVNLSSGQKNPTIDVDLRKAAKPLNLILRFKATYDDTSGILIASLTSLDPVTMRLTRNPLLGFLPVNRSAPEGEGGLFYTVDLRNDLTNINQFSNKASIVFDQEQALITPIWTNIIDSKSPNSRIGELQSITSDTIINLQFHGTDFESGIRQYDLYYAVNSSN